MSASVHKFVNHKFYAKWYNNLRVDMEDLHHLFQILCLTREKKFSVIFPVIFEKLLKCNTGKNRHYPALKLSYYEIRP